MALNSVITIVNDATSSPLVSSYNWDVYATISKASLAILKMAPFDMTLDFKKHFDEQKSTIEQMERRSNPLHTTSGGAPASGGSGCMVMLCAIFGLVVLTIYGLINL